MIMRINRKYNNSIKGHLLTSQRRLLLDLLRNCNGHIDAKELFRQASIKDQSISAATVYRSLNLFKQLGLVDEIRLGKVRCYYEVKQPLEHQHLVCQCCGKVIEFESTLIRKLADKMRHEHGFNVTKAELCLEGYCPECGHRENGEVS